MKSIKYIVCIFTLVVLFSCNEDNANGTYQYSTSLFVATDRHETGDGNAHHGDGSAGGLVSLFITYPTSGTVPVVGVR